MQTNHRFAIRKSQIHVLMTKKHNGMRPQDVVILLKKLTTSGKCLMNKDIAASLLISPSEVSDAMERCRIAGLVDNQKSVVNTLALQDFLVSGLRYVFPVQPGAIVRGMPTAVSASPIKEQISVGNENFVWPYKNGTMRGQAILPLYATVPEAASNDDELYRLLVVAETLRMGRTRERTIAIEELRKACEAYGAEQH